MVWNVATKVLVDSRGDSADRAVEFVQGEELLMGRFSEIALSAMLALGAAASYAMLLVGTSPAPAEEEGWRALPRAAEMAPSIKADKETTAAGEPHWIKERAACDGEPGKGDGLRVKKLDVKPPPLSSISGQSGGEDLAPLSVAVNELSSDVEDLC
jgi:hypothetical protein